MLFAFDLDATLVSDDFRMSDTTLRAVLALRDQGHTVTVITGRTERSAKLFLEPLQVTGFYGTDHGARIVGQGALLHRAEIEAVCLRDIIIRSQAVGASVSFTVHDDVYVEKPESPMWDWLRRFEHRMLTHDAYKDASADKIVMHAPAGHDDLCVELQECYPDLTYYNYETRLEITGKDGHKGAALERLARTLGFAQEDTIAFGDGLNDVSMMQWAGTSIAVGPRAHPEVIAAASTHVAAPEEEGVAEWLYEHFLM